MLKWIDTLIIAIFGAFGLGFLVKREVDRAVGDALDAMFDDDPDGFPLGLPLGDASGLPLGDPAEASLLEQVWLSDLFGFPVPLDHPYVRGEILHAEEYRTPEGTTYTVWTS